MNIKLAVEVSEAAIGFHHGQKYQSIGPSNKANLFHDDKCCKGAQGCPSNKGNDQGHNRLTAKKHEPRTTQVQYLSIRYNTLVTASAEEVL